MSGLQNPGQWFVDLLNGGKPNETNVTSKTVMTDGGVWYAVNKIAGHVGQLPLNFMQRVDRGAEQARDHPLWAVVRERPNAYQVPSVFKEQLTHNMLINGDGRAYIKRAGRRITGLYPLPMMSATDMIEGVKMHYARLEKDDPLYSMLDPDSQGIVRVPDSDVLHLPNLSIDGVEGVKFWEVAKQSMKISLGAQNRTAQQMLKGLVAEILLQAPPNTFRKEADAKEFLENFSKRHSASQDGEAVGLLREGVTANVIQANNQASQFIENRVFQRQEAAIWFLLESILGDESGNSYASLEQKIMAYLSNCLARWLKRWEEECDAKLLSEVERKQYFFKFNTASLLRTDFVSTVNALNSLVMSKIITRNEAREKLDMNPAEGGDVFENPAITVSAQSQPADAATQARLSHLLGVEANRLKSAAKAKNFVEWVTSFYARWEQTLTKAVEDHGGDTSVVKDYCETQKDELLELAGACNKAELPEKIADFTAKFPEKARDLAAKVSEIYV